MEPAPIDGTDPLENYRAIRAELEQHDSELAQRPEIVAISKAELPEAAAMQTELAAAIGLPVLRFSAVTGEGLDVLLREAYKTLAATR